jgi:hypothetical protein
MKSSCCTPRFNFFNYFFAVIVIIIIIIIIIICVSEGKALSGAHEVAT